MQETNTNKPRFWTSVALVGAAFVALLVISLDVPKLTSCNVHAYTLYGNVLTSVAFTGDEEFVDVTYSEKFIDGIKASNADPSVHAILVEIDSYGGQPVAAEEIANTLKRSEKPVVAVIRTAGTSAAYWAATGADTIFASRNSDVGGIGVTISIMNEVEKNKKEGIGYTKISSARFKNLGSPDTDLTEEEEVLLQEDVDTIHENFVFAVSHNRGLELEAVRKIANGASMLGAKALEQGLVDQIGDQYDAEQYLAERIEEEIHVCWQ